MIGVRYKMFLATCLCVCGFNCVLWAGEIPLPGPEDTKPVEPTKPVEEPVDNSISDIQITPLFVTAGIVVKTGTKDELKLEMRELPDGQFKQAHTFYRFDRKHMASSLFGLKPGTEYEVKVGDKVEKFKTMAEQTSLPEAKETVEVAAGGDINAAIKAAKPGTHILVAPGTYATSINIYHVSGTAEAPIVIMGKISDEERKKPIKQRALPIINAEGNGNSANFDGANYVIVDGLQLKNGKGSGVRFTGSTYCTLQNCQVYDNEYSNILISKGADKQHHIIIQDNHIADMVNGGFSFTHDNVEGVTYYGIKRDNNPGWACVIRRNFIEGHNDNLATSGDENQAAECDEKQNDILTRWPNHDVDIYENIVMFARDDAIETDGICVNQRIFNNYFGKSANITSVSPSMPGPFWLIRNICVDGKEGVIKLNTAEGRGVIRGCFYYHNTFIFREKTEEGKGCVFQLWDGTPSKDLLFENNLFYSTERCVQIQPKHTHKPHMDYNLWFSASDATPFVRWGPLRKQNYEEGWVKDMGNDPHGVWGDPKLDMNTFKLQEGSPAIDKALVIPGINDDFKGAAPDIGACEFGQ